VRAIENLVVLNDQSIVADLMALLREDKSVEVRQAAAKALGKLAYRNQDMARFLINILKSEEHLHWLVEEAVILALGELGHQDALPVLIEFLKKPDAGFQIN